MSKLNEFPENLRCSNINSAMHKLLVGECLTETEKMLWSVSIKTRTFASVNTCKLFKASEAISYDLTDAHSITLNTKYNEEKTEMFVLPPRLCP